ncbi:hypothetical protein H7X46_11345 [Pseudonocardia sp. C8]|uniref:hypothetical protein n=1 Tax=Pseudonocardia sp. C8 TaxID=2762759 RepID=UPI0016429CD2|nr:hypothetical protein [Pseudonocardia sp. C8]MBC3191655.1 hypothetical protein [Pseudonocardia sp. C8]
MIVCNTCNWAEAEPGAEDCRECHRMLTEHVVPTPCATCGQVASARRDADPASVRCWSCRDGITAAPLVVPRPAPTGGEQLDQWVGSEPWT